MAVTARSARIQVRGRAIRYSWAERGIWVPTRKETVIDGRAVRPIAGSWSSGYDAAFTRLRSVVQLRPSPLKPASARSPATSVANGEAVSTRAVFPFLRGRVEPGNSFAATVVQLRPSTFSYRTNRL